MAAKPEEKPVAAASVSDSDEGLQDFLRHVFNTMCLGLVITGSISFFISHLPSVAHFLFSFPTFIVTAMLPLGFAYFGFTPQRIVEMEPAKTSFVFAAYSAVMGLSLSCLLWFIAPDSIARMAFVTAAAFAATSHYGLAAKRNLGDMLSYGVMVAAGLLFTFLANFLLHAGTLQYIISGIGMLTFTGIAAWEMHVLKESFAQYRSIKGAKDRLAIAGALMLYLTFIALFQHLLSMNFGQRQRRP